MNCRLLALIVALIMAVLPVGAFAEAVPDEIAEFVDVEDTLGEYCDELPDGSESVEMMELPEVQETAEEESDEDASIVISVPDAIGLGENVQAVFLCRGVITEITEFSCDNDAVIYDAATNTITGNAVGKAQLTVTDAEGNTGSRIVEVKNAPSVIILDDEKIKIQKGNTYTIPMPRLADDEVCNAFTYKTANKKIASVTSKGVIKGLDDGESTKITVTAYNGVSAVIKVSVTAAPESISFKNNKVTSAVGTSFEPVIKGKPAAPEAYTLSSSDENVAVIVDDTIVRCVGSGKAVITCRSYNKKTAKLKLTVPELPSYVYFTPAAETLGTGETISSRIELTPGSMSGIVYTSSDSSIAVVDDEGSITGIDAGTAVITAETVNGLVSSAAVTVMRAPTYLAFKPAVVYCGLEEKEFYPVIEYGDSREGGGITWTSSDTGVASVDGSGHVTLKGLGTCTIKAVTYNGFSAICDLTVGNPPTAVAFAEPVIRAALGDRIFIDPVFTDGCESFTIESADESVVRAEGNAVYPIANGSTTLRIRTLSGLTDECTIEVVSAPERIDLSVDTLTLVRGINPIEILEVEMYPENCGSVCFKTSDPKVANVNSDGTITTAGFGKCTITAVTYNGKTASCEVEVRGILEGRKIGIDPGHQAKHNESKEKVSPDGKGGSKKKVSSGAGGEPAINLSVGLMLRDDLEYLGAEVIMTRTTANVNISNQQRAKLMNANNVDLWLRLHCNSVSHGSDRGIVLYSRKSVAWPASVIPEPKELLRDEKRLSTVLGPQMQLATGSKYKHSKYTNEYTGNNWAQQPCILVEMGYLSNHAEKKLLKNKSYQRKLAAGMVNGICQYYGLDVPVESFI